MFTMDMYKVVEAMRKRASLSKEAGPIGDAVGSIAWSMDPTGIGSIANSIGGIHGLGAKVNPNAEAELDDHGARAILPGVGASRVIQRLRNQLTANDGSSHRYWSTQTGQFTGNIIPGLIGAGVGAHIGANSADEENKGTGAIIGGIAGGVGTVAGINLLAALTAAVTRRRTKQEQAEAAASGGRVAADYLVPGHATYNLWKSYGRSIGDAAERKAQKRQEVADKPEEKTASLREACVADKILTALAISGIK